MRCNTILWLFGSGSLFWATLYIYMNHVIYSHRNGGNLFRYFCHDSSRSLRSLLGRAGFVAASDIDGIIDNVDDDVVDMPSAYTIDDGPVTLLQAADCCHPEPVFISSCPSCVIFTRSSKSMNSFFSSFMPPGSAADSRWSTAVSGRTTSAGVLPVAGTVSLSAVAVATGSSLTGGMSTRSECAEVDAAVSCFGDSATSSVHAAVDDEQPGSSGIDGKTFCLDKAAADSDLHGRLLGRDAGKDKPRGTEPSTGLRRSAEVNSVWLDCSKVTATADGVVATIVAATELDGSEWWSKVAVDAGVSLGCL